MFAFFCTGRPADIYLFMWFHLFCVMDLFKDHFIWNYQSLLLTLSHFRFCDFCTCTFFRDWSNQMSNLPFFFFCYWRINCDTQTRWLRISDMRVICFGWTVNIFARKSKLSLRDCLRLNLLHLSVQPNLMDEGSGADTGLINSRRGCCRL